MTGQDDTTATAGSAGNTQAQGARPWHARLASLVPQTAPTSLVGVVDAYFDVAQGLLEAQRELVKDLAAGFRVGQQPAAAAGEDAPEVAEQDRAEQAERAEHYRAQSRAQLVEELRQRGLPRTGNKAELVERLLEADDR